MPDTIEEQIILLEAKNIKATRMIRDLTEENAILKKKIQEYSELSNLYHNAKKEIERKNQQISEFEKQSISFNFRLVRKYHSWQIENDEKK